MASQLDLFGAPAPASAAPAPQQHRRMPPDRRFAETKIGAWTHRAAALREPPRSAEPAAAARATGLDRVVQRMALEQTGGDALAAARLRMQACQPRLDVEGLGIRINDGPIMAGVRANLEALIARLEGEAEDQP